MSLTMRAASRLAWFSMAATSSALAASAVRPATRSSSACAVGAQPVQFGLTGVQIRGALFGLPGKLVDALLTLAEPVLTALEVRAQPPGLVLGCLGLGLSLSPRLRCRRGRRLGLPDDLRGLALGPGLQLGRVCVGFSLQPRGVGLKQARGLRRARLPRARLLRAQHRRIEPRQASFGR